MLTHREARNMAVDTEGLSAWTIIVGLAGALVALAKTLFGKVDSLARERITALEKEVDECREDREKLHARIDHLFDTGRVKPPYDTPSSQ